MKFRDQPQLHLQVGATFLSRDVMQNVLMFKTLCEVNVSFILP